MHANASSKISVRNVFKMLCQCVSAWMILQSMSVWWSHYSCDLCVWGWQVAVVTDSRHSSTDGRVRRGRSGGVTDTRGLAGRRWTDKCYADKANRREGNRKPEWECGQAVGLTAKWEERYRKRGESKRGQTGRKGVWEKENEWHVGSDSVVNLYEHSQSTLHKSSVTSKWEVCERLGPPT